MCTYYMYMYTVHIICTCIQYILYVHVYSTYYMYMYTVHIILCMCIYILYYVCDCGRCWDEGSHKRPTTLEIKSKMERLVKVSL